MNQTMDLNKLTDVRYLKSLAYDQITIVENAQRNLQAVNVRIAELSGGGQMVGPQVETTELLQNNKQSKTRGPVRSKRNSKKTK